MLQSSSQEAMLKMLEEERDFFKRECESFRTMQQASALKTGSTVRTSYTKLRVSSWPEEDR